MSSARDDFEEAEREQRVSAKILADAVADGKPSYLIEHWASEYRAARDRKHVASLARWGKCHACGLGVDLTRTADGREYQP